MPTRLAIIALLGLTLIACNAEPTFVGAGQCRQCHSQAYTDWQQSDHAKAMQPANAATVLGDFSNVAVNFHAIDSRLSKTDNTFFVDTLNAKGKQQKFEVLYTFGHSPLQQYLVETEKGRLQALNIAWDSRPLQVGGQRWYHLQPDENIAPEHPFFWTGHFQNWNSRCAECHVTNYNKNFDAENNRYTSSWSDGNVACEACHGPASLHVTLAKKDQLNKTELGFSRSKPTPLAWQYAADAPIANPIGTPSDDHLNMCARCHSRRMPLAENKANAEFHNTYHLQLLDQGAYFADGQIQDEVFVTGSFLQSKMHQKGVTCGDCHNPHTGKIKIEGNGLCAQCHRPTVYDTQEHYRHAKDSSGAQCVNCHMPARTYMQVDERRDHSFTIPRPGLSVAIGVPNACTGCHKEKNAAWADEQARAWGGKVNTEHWAGVNQRARELDVLAADALIAQALDSNNQPIVRATLMAQLGGLATQAGARAAAAQLANQDPLLRRAAVSALRSAPVALRWQLLAPHLEDSNRAVRYEIAQTLAEAYQEIPESQRAGLHSLLQEYRQMLTYTLDAPGTQLNLAALELALGNSDKALQAYGRALAIAPAYVPALINASEFHRNHGDSVQAEQLLLRALTVAPDSAMVQHAYGLHLIRRKAYADALGYLARSVELADTQPRHAYVYAVALDSRGDTNAAIKVLASAVQRWPNQYNLLFTLVAYMDKSGATKGINTHLAALNKIAPESAQLSYFRQKYSGSE